MKKKDKLEPCFWEEMKEWNVIIEILIKIRVKSINWLPRCSNCLQIMTLLSSQHFYIFVWLGTLGTLPGSWLEVARLSCLTGWVASVLPKDCRQFPWIFCEGTIVFIIFSVWVWIERFCVKLNCFQIIVSRNINVDKWSKKHDQNDN